MTWHITPQCSTAHHSTAQRSMGQHIPFCSTKSDKLPSSASKSSCQLVHSCKSDSQGAFSKQLQAYSIMAACPRKWLLLLAWTPAADASAAADSTDCDDAVCCCCCWACAMRYAVLPCPRASTDDTLQGRQVVCCHTAVGVHTAMMWTVSIIMQAGS